MPDIFLLYFVREPFFFVFISSSEGGKVCPLIKPEQYERTFQALPFKKNREIMPLSTS